MGFSDHIVFKSLATNNISSAKDEIASLESIWDGLEPLITNSSFMHGHREKLYEVSEDPLTLKCFL